MKNARKIKLFCLCCALLTVSASAFAQGAIVGRPSAQNANQSAAPPAVTPSAAQPVSPTATPAAATSQSREADHEALRALLRQAKEAVNSKNFEALRPLFHEKFTVTTVDQKLFANFDDFKNHFTQLLGSTNAPLTSITFNPEADALTQFIGDNIGLSTGISTDTYHFSDGDTRTMTSRWTATLVKDAGKWEILNLHIGANLLDNPVTEAAKSYVYKVGIGAGLGGLVIGFLIAWLARGKK